MTDPWTRREAIGQALIGSAAMARGSVARAAESAGARGDSVTGGVMMIGLFVDAGRMMIPAGPDLVETSGYAALGHGCARYVYDPRVDAVYVAAHPQSAFISANRCGFRLIGRTVDICQLGAVGDAVVDDTAAIQAALDLVEAAGGGTVMIPVGEYRVTVTLRLPGRVSLVGYGQFSVLHVHGCDGIDVMASDVIGPRRVSDLWLYGQEATGNSAIVCRLEATVRAQGLVFENLYIAFFNTGVRSQGLWHTTFRSVTMNQVWNGFRFTGRNIKIAIDDCRLTHGGLVKGEGYSVGIQVGDASAQRPEDVQIDKTIVYGFGKAIVWRSALFGGVARCDLDACTKTALELVTADGGFVFRDNWVQVNNDAEPIQGINLTPLGYTPQLGNIVIANNRIIAVTAHGMSHGILIGNNQANIVVDANSVTGQWSEGIRIDGTCQVRLTGNKAEATIWIGNSSNVALHDNYAGKGIALYDNQQLSAGATFGPHGTRITGSLAFPAGSAKASVTFASLGLPDLPSGSYKSTATFVADAGTYHGNIAGRVTQTGVAVALETPVQAGFAVSFIIELH